MTIFVCGGSASGKSSFAEKTAFTLAQKEKTELIYIACMKKKGQDALRRIKLHRRQRKNLGFTTIEQYTALDKLDTCVLKSATVLIEDLGNLAANTLYSPAKNKYLIQDEQEVLSSIKDGLNYVQNNCLNLIIVGNDIFRDWQYLNTEFQVYFTVLAALNRYMAAKAATVVECCSGTAIYHKGRQV